MLSNGLRCLPNSDFGEVLEWWVDGVVKMGGLCDAYPHGALEMLKMESLAELWAMDEVLEMLKAECLIELWETKCSV